MLIQDDGETAIDLTKLPEEILVQLINRDNKSKLTTALVGFKTPAPAPSQAPRNTEVVVYAKRRSGLRGEVKVFYDRLNIVDIVGQSDIIFDLDEATRLSELIPDINQRYGINLTPQDYVDIDLSPTAGGFGNTYSLAFHTAPESLVYFGSINFTIRTNEPEGIQLSAVITDRILDIFTYTPPT